MPPKRDIRDHIPRTKQTDPNNFPVPEHRRYPLMMVGPDNKPYTDEAGKPVIVRSKEEEDAFRADHPEAKEVLDPQDRVDELERLRRENRELKASQSVPGPTPSVSGGNEPEAADLAKGNAEQPRPAGGGLKGTVKPAPKPGSKLD